MLSALDRAVDSLVTGALEELDSTCTRGAGELKVACDRGEALKVDEERISVW